MDHHVAGSTVASGFFLGFMPVPAFAQEAIVQVGGGNLPVPQSIGEITWPFVALVALWWAKDFRPALNVGVHVEVGVESRKWVEGLWAQFRRTFRRTFDKDDDEKSDDPSP